MRRSLKNLGLVMALVILGTFTTKAVTRPFHLVEQGKAKVTAREDNETILDLVSEGEGTATHIGHFTVDRAATLTPTGAANVFNFNGNATFTTANGDTLESSIVGTIDFNAGHADLIYEWEGGSGRFENASGTTFWSIELNNGAYTVVADGAINY